MVNSAYLLANLFGAIHKNFHPSQVYIPPHRVRQLFLQHPWNYEPPPTASFLVAYVRPLQLKLMMNSALIF